MLRDLVTIDLLICDRILVEADGVLSAIRLVDVFFVDPETPDGGVEKVLPMQILITSKFTQGAAKNHIVELALIRPDGERKPMVEPREVVIEAKYPDLPSGFNVLLHAAVKVKQLGTHQLVLSVDGEELRQAPFTLLPRPDAES
jgi:hypothetical protein